MTGILTAIGLGAAIWLAPLPVEPAAHRLAAIFAGTAVLWITETLPLGASALLAMALCAVAGVADVKEVFRSFSDPIMLLMLGSFMLANALTACGLDRRLARAAAALPGVQGSPWRLFAVLGIMTALISCWITNTATTAMMIPIALGVVARLEGGDTAKRRYAAALLLLTAYASTAGGIATPVGTGTNLVGIALLKQEGMTLDLFAWARFGGAMALVQLLALLVIFRVFMGRHLEGLRIAEDESTRDAPLDGAQRWTAAAFGATVALWVAPGAVAQVLGAAHPASVWMAHHLPECAVPFLALGMLFAVRTGGKPVLDWNRAIALDWGALLLFAGGVSLGQLAFSTGLAKVIGEGLVAATGATGNSALCAAFTGISIVVSELSSNVATASMLVPVAIGSAHAAGIAPAGPALAVTIAASLGCMMPVSTPPNALVYGTGRIPLKTMLVLGLVFDLLGFFIVWGGLSVLGPG